VWKEVQKKHPYEVEAICLLPDHLHCSWRLPSNDCDYPKRWRLINGMFSKRYLKAGSDQVCAINPDRKRVKLLFGNDVIGSILSETGRILSDMLITFTSIP
jgi:REP element-mobilizing transposase RayT